PARIDPRGTEVVEENAIGQSGLGATRTGGRRSRGGGRAEDDVVARHVEQIVAEIAVLVDVRDTGDGTQEQRVRTSALGVVEEAERVAERSGVEVVRRIHAEAVPLLECGASEGGLEDVALAVLEAPVGDCPARR